MIVQVTGDRNWTDKDRLKVALVALTSARRGDPHTLRHGAARGADTLFAEVAYDLGWIVERYPADWKTYGRAAGPIRNKVMVKAEPQADVCLYAHDDLDNSKGTANMVKQCATAGIPTKRVP